nr:MAG TPA: hypothetical protein [Bacteriophage sp.]
MILIAGSSFPCQSSSQCANGCTIHRRAAGHAAATEDVPPPAIQQAKRGTGNRVILLFPAALTIS